MAEATAVAENDKSGQLVTEDAPADVSAQPANLADLSPDAVDDLHDAGARDGDAEEEDESLVDLFADFVDKVKARQQVIAPQEFVGKITKTGPRVLRDEVLNYAYEYLTELADLCGAHADLFERVEDKVAEMREEVMRQGEVVRTMASNYVNMLALALAKQVLDGAPVESQKQVASQIYIVIEQIQKMAAEQLAAAARRAEREAPQDHAAQAPEAFSGMKGP